MKTICGIYGIESKSIPSRYYIGSSRNISKRFSAHKGLLKKNKHQSIKLQRHYDKYGIDDLNFVVLYECDEDKLLEIEQSFLDHDFPYFNSSIYVGSPMLGKKFSIGAKNKIGNAVRKAWKEGKYFRVGCEEARNKQKNTIKNKEKMVTMKFLKQYNFM